ncbi:hypothetical protein Tco_1008032 [Tanacetum coccineum]
MNQKVKTIRSDNGTEFKNKDVSEFCGSGNGYHTKNKKKAKNDQTKHGMEKTKSNRSQIQSKSKVSHMKKIQLKGLKLPNLKLYYKRKKTRVEIANRAKFYNKVIRDEGPKQPTFPNSIFPAQTKPRLGVIPINEVPMKIYYDNTGAIATAKDPGITKSAKHYRTEVHYLCELDDIVLEKVHTDDNVADSFM